MNNIGRANLNQTNERQDVTVEVLQILCSPGTPNADATARLKEIATNGERYILSVPDGTKQRKCWTSTEFSRLHFIGEPLETQGCHYNCTFIGGNWHSLGDGTRFIDCTFESCQFSENSCFQFEEGVFRNCSFDCIRPSGHIDNCRFENCQFRNGRWNDMRADNCEFVDCDFLGLAIGISEAPLEEVALSRLQFDRCNLHEINADGSLLRDTSFFKSHVRHSSFRNAVLDGLVMQRSSCGYNDLTETVFKASTGLVDTEDIGTTRIEFHRDARVMPSLERDRSFFKKLIRWENLASLCRIRFFSVSYTVLLYYIARAYLTRGYNSFANVVQAWGADILKSQDSSWAIKAVAELAIKVSQPIEGDVWSAGFFVAALSLVFGNSLFWFFCPDEIKEFTRAQWKYSAGRSEIAYAGLSRTFPCLRLLIGLFLFAGGVPFLLILFYRIGIAARILTGAY
ncbi:pentapeptide repeat-containing protein [Crateriforma conspicua]|uniref:pentapeptide repeat-containing protein n=1 Tax=Crateriforma conspicua TaxID=2527996 RepID=UPI00118D336B|nr:pentapeptide repeat-containing protein [Crateriforma conspicua]QDV63056.1 hypothetical protein Mal65_21950 [Crateriforma conspicua]